MPLKLSQHCHLHWQGSWKNFNPRMEWSMNNSLVLNTLDRSGLSAGEETSHWQPKSAIQRNSDISSTAFLEMLFENEIKCNKSSRFPHLGIRIQNGSTYILAAPYILLWLGGMAVLQVLFETPENSEVRYINRVKKISFRDFQVLEKKRPLICWWCKGELKQQALPPT